MDSYDEYSTSETDSEWEDRCDEAVELHVAELNEALDHALAEDWDSAYFEILAKPGIRRRKPTA